MAGLQYNHTVAFAMCVHSNMFFFPFFAFLYLWVFVCVFCVCLCSCVGMYFSVCVCVCVLSHAPFRCISVCVGVCLCTQFGLCIEYDLRAYHGVVPHY